MTLDVAAIFADDIDDSKVVPVVEVSAVVDREVETVVVVPAFEPWPIAEGTEHYQVFVPDDDTPWPDFIPGYHYDFRQQSHLRPLLG